MTATRLRWTGPVPGFAKNHLAEDFSLYLHRPTATDPSLAPANHDNFYVLSPVPHLDADVDWAVEGPRYQAAIAERLESTLLPGLRERLVTSFHVTPHHFHDNLLSFKGAAFGMRPTLMQSAWFRPHNKDSDIEGLYLVGAGTHPGAGVPGVLCSAKILDKVVPAPQRPHHPSSPGVPHADEVRIGHSAVNPGGLA